MARSESDSAPESKDDGSKEHENKNLVEEGEDDDIDYSELYDALEEISSYLDDLEEKNQSLNKELTNLLESNRKIRRELQNAAA